LQEEQAISHDHHLIFPVAALTIKIKTIGGHPEEEGRTLVRPEPELCDDESEEDEGRRKEERGKREEDLEEGERACFITNGSTLIRP